MINKLLHDLVDLGNVPRPDAKTRQSMMAKLTTLVGLLTDDVPVPDEALIELSQDGRRFILAAFATFTLLMLQKE